MRYLDGRNTRKLLLIAVGWLAIAMPGVMTAQATAAPSFDVATIKPSDPNKPGGGIGFGADKFTTNGQTVKVMMKFAYNLNIGTDQQISGGPSWIGTAKFDIEAKMDPDTIAALQKLPTDQRRERLQLMVRELLADRFKLKVHHETKELPIYALMVVKGGSKLKPAVDALPVAAHGGPGGAPTAALSTWHGLQMQGRGKMEGRSASPDMLGNVLGFQPEIGGRMVVDKTGLKGAYDFILTWTPDPTLGSGGRPDREGDAPIDPTGPSLFTALQEQLGLKLEATKGPVDTIVIDSVEMPSEN